MDEEIKRILQSPSAWLFGVAVAAFCGVWWATMTPNKTNISLVIGVLAFSGAVFFHSRLATEPMLARSLLSIVVAAVLGLVVYNVAWDRSAGESKKAAVSVDNIESKVDEWLRGYHIKFTQLPKGGSFFFRYDAVTQGGTPIAFGRPIEHPTFLWIQAELDVSLTADQWAWISRLSRSEREQLDRDLA